VPKRCLESGNTVPRQRVQERTVHHRISLDAAGHTRTSPRQVCAGQRTVMLVKMALPAVSEFQDIVDPCCGTSFTP
jgi:hypothetical protein